MGVGTALQHSTTRQDLIVGGNLSFNTGSVAGVIVYGGSYTKNASVGSSGASQGHPIDFGSAAQTLQQLATTWSQRQANGQTTESNGGQVSFTGTDPNLDVFAAPGAEVANARSLSVKVPSGATTLINVSGPASQLKDGVINLSGTSADKVIWNFHQATELSISGIRVEGSVFAPRAAVSFSNGHIDGTVVASSLEGSGESGNTSFSGCIPTMSTIGGSSGNQSSSGQHNRRSRHSKHRHCKGLSCAA
jgi:choice-of-anchor A domain-containing protein